MFLCGGATGIVFDAFRALRRCIKSGSGVIAAQDLLLWLLELVIVYYTVFKVNNAEIRGYEAIALALGAIIYFITLSEYAVKFISKIIFLLLKALSFILKPLKKLVGYLKLPLKKFLSFLKTRQITLRNFIKNVKFSVNSNIKTVWTKKKSKI